VVALRQTRDIRCVHGPGEPYTTDQPYPVEELLDALLKVGAWPLGPRQSVEIIGAIHIGALANLLPLPKTDGQ
jgi:hypothetical protein